MKRHAIVSVLLSFFLALSCSIAAGQQDAASCGRAWNPSLSSVAGEIESMYFAVPPGSGKAGLHLRLRTASGEEAVVHVFPKDCVEKNPAKFNFREGEHVTALGSLFSSGKDAINICAAIIFQDAGRSLELRDPDSGRMNYSLCSNCSRICENACRGKPIMCVQRCMGTCGSSY